MAETESLGLEVFVEGWQKFNQIMDKLDKGVDGLEKGMKGASKSSGAFSVAVGTLAAGAVAKLSDVLVDAGRKAVDFTKESITMAADFQSSMAVLSIAASSTGMTFDELKAAALAVGGDTRLLGVSATGAAESLTGLFKAGLTGTEVFGDLNAYMNEGAQLGGALRASIDLAAATELDMVQASDLAAIALASFGSELETEAERAEFVNKAMNNMVKAADASVAEVSGLAEALKMVGATAGGMGVPIEDINNALAVLSTRGIQGSMAGTSLNRMLLDITKTTPQASAMMEQLGINVYDMEGNLLPLIDIVGQFETALGTATDAEQAAAMQAIFTAQGQRAMNTLLTEGVAGWDAMATATEAAAGIQEQAAVRSETFSARMEALDGVIETVKISIGDAFLPVATELVDWFAEIVSVHGPAIAEWLGEKVPEAINTLKVFFTDTLIPAIEQVVAWVKDNMVPILGALAAVVLSVVIPAAVSLVTTLAPIILVIGAIAAAGALLAKAWDEDWLGMKTTLTAFWEDSVKPAFEAVKEWLAVFIPEAIKVAQDYWENTLKPALETVWEFIQDNVIPILETLWEWLGETIPIVIKELADLWENLLKPALEIVWNFIKESIVPLLTTLWELIKESLMVAITALAGLWTNVLKPALETAYNYIKDNVNPILTTMQEIFDKIKKVVDTVTYAIGQLISKVKNFELPDLLTPGSPTPFELGLRGIASAMREVSAMSGIMSASMPGIGGIGGMSPSASPGMQIVNNITNQGDTNEFNFTAQSLMQPGQMQMEFATMAMRSR